MTAITDAISKLHQLQKDLKAPKGQYNNFGKYHYRSCEDILQAAKAVMPDDAIILVFDSIEMVGNRIYVKATAQFSYKGQLIETTAYAREPEMKKGMDESQITGAASSYARKYALNGLLLIDDNKDADSMDNTQQQVAPKKKQTASQLLQIISSGDEISTVQYWRSLNQSRQQQEWTTLDKETQKHLKQLMQTYPAEPTQEDFNNE